jgi:hypothetical protein
MSFPCAVSYDLSVYQGKVDEEAAFEAAAEKIVDEWKVNYSFAEFEAAIPDKYKSAWEEFIWDIAWAEVKDQKNDWQGEPY